MNENKIKENAATLARMDETKSLIESLGENLKNVRGIREKYEADDRRASAADRLEDRITHAIDEACALYGIELATLTIDRE